MVGEERTKVNVLSQKSDVSCQISDDSPKASSQLLKFQNYHLKVLTYSHFVWKKKKKTYSVLSELGDESQFEENKPKNVFEISCYTWGEMSHKVKTV